MNEGERDRRRIFGILLGLKRVAIKKSLPDARAMMILAAQLRAPA